ncbi:MAG TPA: SDR family oxidoreductase [Acidimicrobiales bacterium]|jgi:3-oxoacyl-[acyl-carrier protein] reductase|nr:SDR family oxidoreductase [Acidimicrobiales bacterium]
MTIGQFRVDGKAAVVTGAASGIGRATAIALSDAGARLVLADRDEDNLDKTLKMVDEAIVVPTDVSKKADVDALVASAVSHYGRVDVMANIAGIMGAGGPISSIEEGVLDRVLAVNLKGVFFGVQAALRVMGEQGSGSIVNMASAAIDAPAANLAVYSMAKAGVAMLTRVAAQEGGPLGVRVNCVAPGFVVTPMTQRGEPERQEAVEASMRKRSALGAIGDPDDIANAVLYLASDASRYMTGQTLRPNGGTVMPA